MSRSVAVSGIGIVSPFGTSHQSFIDGLLEGHSAIAPLEGFDTSGCVSTLAAQATAFEPTQWVSPMRLRRLERTAVYTAAITRLAFDDAGGTPSPDGDDTTGIVLGTWTAGGEQCESYLDAFFKGGPQAAPALLFESTVGNAPASFAALEYKLRGPNATISQREASGLVAIATAVEMLRLGRARRLITGGVDIVFETFFRAWDRFHIMSPARTFSRAVAPFDAERSGFILGEGGIALCLELQNAAVASAALYGWIIGAAESSVAVRPNDWPISPEPLVRTMREAIDDAGIRPTDIAVVYAAANATRQLDFIEAQALDQLFGGSATVITSIKGAIGEAGLSCASSCAAAFLCGRRGHVPPIAGLVEPDPAAARLNLARKCVAAPGPIALVNGFASGGTLCSVVLRVRD